MDPATPRPPLTRSAIVAEARRQIRSDGLDSLSLRRIGTALGVTAPALYAYVEGKQDLLRAVAEGELTVLLARFDAVTVTDPVDRLAALGATYVDYAVANPELFRTMFLFPPAIDGGQPTGQELDLATEAMNYPVDVVRDGMATGVLAGDDPFTVTFAAWATVHGLATVLNLGFDFDDATRARLVTATLNTLFDGLRPR